MKNYAGIDVSKNFFDVAIYGQKKVFHFEYNEKGLAKCIEQLRKNNIALVVIESTGGYETQLAIALQVEELAVAIVNPKRIRDFAKAKGLLAKTDKIDAGNIAHYAAMLEPPQKAVITANACKLKALMSRRRQLVKMQTVEKNHKEHSFDKCIKRSIDNVLKIYEKEMQNIDKELHDLIDSMPELKRRTEIFTSIPGIGAVTAALLVTELPELGQCNKRQIAALIGVAPKNCDSGKYRGKRFTGGGRWQVRTGLFMATMVAVRHNPQMKAFYQRLVSQGKTKMTAMIAAMRKFVIIINTMVKNDQLWNENLA